MEIEIEKEKYSCANCNTILKEPTSLCCKHNFCDKCIKTYVDRLISKRKRKNGEFIDYEIHPDMIPCPLCKKDYFCAICIGVLTEPISLCCGHNFCGTCIKSYVDGLLSNPERRPDEFIDYGIHLNMVPCPLCKKDFFTKNLNVNSLLEKLLPTKKETARGINFGSVYSDHDEQYDEEEEGGENCLFRFTGNCKRFWYNFFCSC